MDNNQRLRELLDRYLDDHATEIEKIELWDYLENPLYMEEIEEMLSSAYQKDRAGDGISEIQQQLLLKHIFTSEDAFLTKPAKSVKLWPKWVAAASIALAFLAGGYFYYQVKNDKLNTEGIYANDIAPGKEGATLTLANGEKILINDALAGNIASQSGVKISKTENGEIIYEVIPDDNKILTYNTLTTTRGEQTRVRLPDGTLVFLNAQSSLKYPTSFANTAKREVALSGEGYFEVAKDKLHPFIVATDKQRVEVLGTHFNISSYPDEENIRTTLLEGSVKVVSGSSKSLLVPNQQASMGKDGLKVREVNVDEVVSWKNGMFAFSDLPLEEIMKKIARWYNVEVVYEQGVNKAEAYGGSVSRYDNVSRVLSKLELTGSVHFKVEGRRIIVTK